MFITGVLKTAFVLSYVLVQSILTCKLGLHLRRTKGAGLSTSIVIYRTSSWG